MSREFFDAELRRLTVLRFPPADIDGYWDALRDIPAEIFVAAMGHALKTRSHFPVPAEIRADADHVAASLRRVESYCDADRIQPLDTPRIMTLTFDGVTLRLPISGEYSYYCEDCSDIGWASFWCGPATSRRGAWVKFQNCDRRGAHGSHEWVQHCACYASNPALLRKRAAMLKYSDGPQKVA